MMRIEKHPTHIGPLHLLFSGMFLIKDFKFHVFVSFYFNPPLRLKMSRPEEHIFPLPLKKIKQISKHCAIK